MCSHAIHILILSIVCKKSREEKSMRRVSLPGSRLVFLKIIKKLCFAFMWPKFNS